jgi:hypothetical protein
MQQPALEHLGEVPRLQRAKKRLKGANRIVGRRRLKDRAYPIIMVGILEGQNVRHAVILLLLVLTLATVGAAQDLPDVERLGPQVGDVVPSFSLTDQHGQTQTLQSVMGPNGVMLVFNRSASW